MITIHSAPAHMPLPTFKCLTAGGILIHQDKVLLVKHKKVQWWLAPGGHVDPDELPHLAVEREFQEETGIIVQAVPIIGELIPATHTEYLPNPMLSNLHWVGEDNYQARIKSEHPDQRHASKLFPRGCEQHLFLLYLVKSVGSLEHQVDPVECDGIGWFAESEIDNLETTPDIKEELHFAFKVWRRQQSQK